MVIIEGNDTVREKVAGLISRMESVMLVCLARSTRYLKEVVTEIEPHILLIEESCILGNVELLNSIKEPVDGLKLVLMVEENGKTIERSGISKKVNLDAIIDKKKIHSEFAEFINREFR